VAPAAFEGVKKCAAIVYEGGKGGVEFVLNLLGGILGAFFR